MNDYTDEGQLLGLSIVIGAQMVHDLAKEVPDFPEKRKSGDPLYSCIMVSWSTVLPETGTCGAVA